MKFLCSVTILLVFFILMLLTKLNFKPNQVLKRKDRLQELRRPVAKIIIDDDFALSTTAGPPPKIIVLCPQIPLLVAPKNLNFS